MLSFGCPNVSGGFKINRRKRNYDFLLLNREGEGMAAPDQMSEVTMLNDDERKSEMMENVAMSWQLGRAESKGASMDWTSVVRPILAASYGNVSTNDMIKLARSIQANRQEILDHSSQFTHFYSSLVALSSHFICAQITSVDRCNLATFTGACRVLIEYLVRRSLVDADDFSLVQTVLLVTGLCTGRACLYRSDVSSLAARIKSSQLPAHVRTTIAPEKAPPEDGMSAKCPRLSSAHPTDATLNTLLLVPIHSHLNDPIYLKSKLELSVSVESLDVKEAFINANIQNLIGFDAPFHLLTRVSESSLLALYRDKYNDCVNGRSVTFADYKDQTVCKTILDRLAALEQELCHVEILLDQPLMSTLTERCVPQLTSICCSSLLAVTDAVIAYDGREETVCQSLTSASLKGIMEKCCQLVNVSAHIQPKTAADLHTASTLILALTNRQLTEFISPATFISVQFSQTLLKIVLPLITGPDLIRLSQIYDQVPLYPLFISIARTSLVEAIMSKHLKRQAECAHMDEASVDTTTTSDICNDEAILGNWLEELLSSVPAMVDEEMKKEKSQRSTTPDAPLRDTFLSQKTVIF